MSSFNSDAWASADVNADQESNTPPDPGLYEVVVADAKAFTSKAGNDVAIIEWQVTNGPLTGYKWPDVRGFKNEGQIKAAKSMCARLGIDVDAIGGLDELDTALKATLGEYYTVEVVQNGEWRNTYVNGKSSGQQVPISDIPDDGAFKPAPAKPATDKIPF